MASADCNADHPSLEPPAFINPLPGHKSVWENTSLAPSEKWPSLLQAFVLTLPSFDYPTAIFWGAEFTLLHNQAWSDVGGTAQQGRPQRDSLPAAARQALRDSLGQGKPRRVAGRDLLRCEVEESDIYTALITPIFDQKAGERKGIIAQLIPESTSPSSRQADVDQEASIGDSRFHGKKSKSLNRVDLIDKVPMDEHPFISRFAEMLPTGLAILDHEAHAVFVNRHFYELTTHMGSDKSFKSWPQSIHPEDYDRVLGAYRDAFKSQKPTRTEYRSSGSEHPWRLLLLTPLGKENLNHVSVERHGGFICSVVDITSEKRAELAQRKAAREAEERKEQQERFIDMISHEIRNPLSAVLHCVEDIEDSIKSNARQDIQLDDILEATETIYLCISHQKAIVDDVLSYSKLDSSMLALTPKPCRPDQQLVKSLKMFQPELRKQVCDFEYSIDAAYGDMSIDWVMADLVRVGQIITNLMTNAIKFTSRKTGERKISCRVGASLHRPCSYPPEVVFFDTETHDYRLDKTGRSEWGSGEPMYVMFAIKDTGIGISDEGQKRLFERFKQATPKTGEIYGGSGLGLNISRKLVHLHGGEIGVASREGQGTTFGFFFRVRRVEGPREDTSTSDEVEWEDERFRDQIRAHGMIAPIVSNPKQLPQSLRDPPVRSARDDMCKEESEAPEDDRREHTADLLAEVVNETRRKGEGVKRDAPDSKHADGSIHLAVRPDKIEDMETLNTGACKTEAAFHDITTSVHILLVEDNIVNQRVLSRKLSTKGFTISVANNGREAVDAIRETMVSYDMIGSRIEAENMTKCFSVILMDQEMPVMDGNAATREIRRLEREIRKDAYERLPILGVSANVRTEQRDEMMRSGMDDVITKPYRMDDLVDKIGSLVRRGRDTEAAKRA